MKWFDTKEIKNKENLTSEQIEYLKKASLTVFGPFNVLFRKHWDFILAFILIYLLDEFIAKTFALSLAVFVGSLYVNYFTIIHGRRHAWNRNEWKDFQDFEQSEKKWMPWGMIFFAIWLLSNIIILVA